MKKEGIKLDIITFKDAVISNQEVAKKGLYANYIQHISYLEDFNKKYNTNIVSIAKIHVESLALYSKKLKSIDELSERAEILITNNVTNSGRALLLLYKHV